MKIFFIFGREGVAQSDVVSVWEHPWHNVPYNGGFGYGNENCVPEVQPEVTYLDSDSGK